MQHPTSVRCRSLSQVGPCWHKYLLLMPTAPGSGITLYVAHENESVNASITLDGNSSSATKQTLLNNSTVELYNITLYDIQSLPFGDHEVTVAMLGWVTGGDSQLWFDYAAVNDSHPSPKLSATPSASASPSTSGSGSGHSQ